MAIFSSLVPASHRKGRGKHHSRSTDTTDSFKKRRRRHKKGKRRHHRYDT